MVRAGERRGISHVSYIFLIRYFDIVNIWTSKVIYIVEIYMLLCCGEGELLFSDTLRQLEGRLK